MNVTSKTVRLIATTVTFMLVLSCSDQVSTQENTLQLQDVNVSKQDDRAQQLLHYYTFDNSANLLTDEQGTFDFVESSADFSSEGLLGGAAVLSKDKFIQMSESRQRTGYFHDKFYTRSYSVWFKANRTDKTHFIIEEGGRINSMALRIRKNKLMAGVTTRGQRNRVIIKTPFTDTENWHHAAVVFDNGSFSLYLDGTLIDTKQAKFDFVRNHPNGGAIGARYGGSTFNKKKFWKYCKKKKKHKKHKHKKKCKRYTGNYFDGMIDEVMVFSTAITPDVITGIIDNATGNDDGGDDDDNGDTGGR